MDIDYTVYLSSIDQKLESLINLCGYIFSSLVLIITLLVIICIAKILNKTILNHF